jgi:hypothetical protein
VVRPARAARQPASRAPGRAGQGETYHEDTGCEKLRAAMGQNPYLHVLTQSGYYDGACDYFNAKCGPARPSLPPPPRARRLSGGGRYSMWNMEPSGKLKGRLSWLGHRSGHMMYLRAEDLASANDDIRAFIRSTTPKAGQAAKC